MALSDAQIDRFSRQIILPQIGGRGQERLLQSSVAIAGAGEVATITALYLASAGIGRIALHGCQRLSAALNDLNPEVRVTLPSGALGSIAADVLVACDAPRAELDGAVASGRPLIAGGVTPHGGWVIVADAPGICASCAARHAGGSGVSEHAPAPPSLSPSVGVVGSLLAVAAVKLRVGLGTPGRRVWLQFDPTRSTLTEHPLARAADCPVCAVGERT